MGFRKVRHDLATEQQNLLFFRYGDDWAIKHSTQHDEVKDQETTAIEWIACFTLRSQERISLVVQWLRFHAPNAGGLSSSISGQGTSGMPQPEKKKKGSHMPQ